MTDLTAVRFLRAQYAAAKHLRETGSASPEAVRQFIAEQRAWSAYDRELIEDGLLRKSAAGASDLSDAVQAAAESFAKPDAFASVIDIAIARGAAVVDDRTRLMANGNLVTAGWPGEGGAIRVQKADMQGSAIRRKKVGAIVVASAESLEDASPETEAALQNELRAAARNAINECALDWERAGDDATPAALVYGVTEINSSGSPATDAKAALRELSDRGSDLSNVIFVGHPRTAGDLATILGSGGAPSYPGMSGAGGTLAGHAFIASAAVPNGGSPTASSLLAIDLNDVVITDGGARVALTDEGAIEMSDAPTGQATTPTAASSYLESMYQAECVAIRITRRINWALRHGRAVVISAVAY